MKSIKQWCGCCALFLALLGFAPRVFAQDTTATQKPAETGGDIKFVAAGDYFTGAQWVPAANGSPERLTMTTTGINPVFLWSIGDNLLVESEVEFQLQGQSGGFDKTRGYAAGEGLAIELEYANLGYFLNDYTVLRVGSFFSSMGVFEDWYHQRITNRFIDRPIGIGHITSGLMLNDGYAKPKLVSSGIESAADFGFNITGGIPLGSAKMNYSIDLTTGPSLVTELSKDEEGYPGQLKYEGINSRHESKLVGLKLGFLPLSNSSLEFGGSYNRALVGDVYGVGATANTVNTQYAGIGATFTGAYLSYIQDIDAISGTVLFRGQYDNLKVDDATYEDPAAADSTGAIPAGKTYTFNNQSSSYFAQISYRPSMVSSPILRKFEIGVRIGDIAYPANAHWGDAAKALGNQNGLGAKGYGQPAQETKQLAIALDYWLKWNAVVKLQYTQNTIVNQYKGTIAPPPANVQLQMAMGF